MNGPARLTAWASPFSPRSLMSQLRCTSAKASGAVLGGLQKKLAQLPFIRVELLRQLLVFTTISCFSQQAIFDNRIQYYAFVA